MVAFRTLVPQVSQRVRGVIPDRLTTFRRSASTSESPGERNGGAGRGLKQKLAAAGALAAVGVGTFAGVAAIGHSAGADFGKVTAEPTSAECTAPVGPRLMKLGVGTDGKTYSVDLGQVAKDATAGKPLSAADEAAACSTELSANTVAQQSTAILANKKSSSAAKTQARQQLEVAGVASAEARRFLSSDDSVDAFTSTTGNSKYVAALASTATDNSGAGLQSAYKALVAEKAQLGGLQKSEAIAFTDTDQAVLDQGISAKLAAKYPGAVTGGKDLYATSVKGASGDDLGTLVSGLGKDASATDVALSNLQASYVKAVGADYLADGKTIPDAVQAQIKDALAKNEPFGTTQAAVAKAYRASPGVAEAHVGKILSGDINPLVEQMLPGSKADATVQAKVKEMYLAGASQEDIHDWVVGYVVDTPAFHIAKQGAGMDIQPENAAGTDCSIDAATNIIKSLLPWVTESNQQIHDEYANFVNFYNLGGVPGGTWDGDHVKSFVKQKWGVDLVGDFNPSREVGPMKDAMNGGYEILINGNVRGSSAGHFLDAQHVNGNGTNKMMDSVTGEFWNRNIDDAALSDFTHNGQNPPGFYGLRLSQKDMMARYGNQFLAQRSNAVQKTITIVRATDGSFQVKSVG